MGRGAEKTKREKEKRKKGKREEGERKSSVHILFQLFRTPWIVACQASLPVEFSKQEYRSGLPFPSSTDLSNPGIEPEDLASSALGGRLFTT